MTVRRVGDRQFGKSHYKSGGSGTGQPQAGGFLWRRAARSSPGRRPRSCVSGLAQDKWIQKEAAEIGEGTPHAAMSPRDVRHEISSNSSAQVRDGLPSEAMDVLTSPQGLVESLLLKDVCAYLGSMWRVTDRAAETFALAFYNALLQGHMTGEAVRCARTAVIQKHGESQQAWASDALYGPRWMTLRREMRLGTDGSERSRLAATRPDGLHERLLKDRCPLVRRGSFPIPWYGSESP
jgi:hypothetical protein